MKNKHFSPVTKRFDGLRSAPPILRIFSSFQGVPKGREILLRKDSSEVQNPPGPSFEKGGDCNVFSWFSGCRRGREELSRKVPFLSFQGVPKGHGELLREDAVAALRNEDPLSWCRKRRLGRRRYRFAHRTDLSWFQGVSKGHELLSCSCSSCSSGGEKIILEAIDLSESKIISSEAFPVRFCPCTPAQIFPARLFRSASQARPEAGRSLCPWIAAFSVFHRR